jgi:hypothetical protein
MSKVQVLIAGVLLKQDQADAVLEAALIMFHRAEKYLKEYRCDSKKIAHYLEMYLRSAEIIHLFHPEKKIDHVHFHNGRATLMGSVETTFGKR